ncbi:MAG: Cof-type HAD-IIB family hydrolase [Ktedonobacteraceae bacterium]
MHILKQIYPFIIQEFLMYRLIAIDLDGTLLTPAPNKSITPHTHDILCKAVDQGITIVIATGQTLQVLRQVCANLPLSTPQIIENGAVVANFADGRILFEQPFPQEYILPVLDILHSFGFYRVYHTHDSVYVDSDTPRARTWYRPPIAPPVEVADVASLYPLPCIKLVGVGETETLREKRLKLEEIFAGKLYVTQSSFDLIEFLHPDVSKGNALRVIAANLGIAPEEVVAIGDNHNDIGMLRFAGLGVAMGNAHDEVKAAADYVTLSNAEEGVAAVIEKLVLPTLR